MDDTDEGWEVFLDTDGCNSIRLKEGWTLERFDQPDGDCSYRAVRITKTKDV